MQNPSYVSVQRRTPGVAPQAFTSRTAELAAARAGRRPDLASPTTKPSLTGHVAGYAVLALKAPGPFDGLRKVRRPMTTVALAEPGHVEAVAHGGPTAESQTSAPRRRSLPPVGHAPVPPNRTVTATLSAKHKSSRPDK